MPCAPCMNSLPHERMNLPSGSNSQTQSPVGEALWMKIRPSAVSHTPCVLPYFLPSGSLPQPSTHSYWYGPLPMTVDFLSFCMAERMVGAPASAAAPAAAVLRTERRLGEW